MKNNYITIHAYKHNGTLYRAWEDSKILEESDNRIVLMNDKVKVTEVDGRKWKTKEPAILFFYKDKWYNIIVQFKEKGIFFYCNIASPYLIEERPSF